MALTYHAGRRIQGLSTDTINTVWNNATSSNVIISENHISPSSSATGWNDARAKTSSYISRGRSMTFVIDTSGQGFVTGAGYWGIDEGSTVLTTTSTLDYAFYIDGSGTTLTMIQNNSTVATNTFVRGDTLEIAISSSGVVTYKKNNSVIYTSSVTATSNNYYGQYLSIYSGTAGFGGTSTLIDKPTNVQVGSRFEETDTRKIYFVAPTPTFEEQFTDVQATLDTRFPKTGTLTAPNASTDVMDWDSNSTTNQSSTHDIGYDLDTKFVLRSKVIIDAITNTSSNSHQIYIGLFSADHTSGANVGQDGFALYILADTVGSNNLKYRLRVEGAGTVIQNTAGEATFTELPNTGETIYVEMIRNGDIFTISLYSDSGFTTLIESQTFTETSVAGLRYLGIKNFLNSTSGGSLNGTWDTIQLWNGVSSPTGWTEEA